MGDGLPMLFSLMLLSLMTVRVNAWTHKGPAMGYWTRDDRERLPTFRFARSVRTSRIGRWMHRVSQKKHLGPLTHSEITSEGNFMPDPSLIFPVFKTPPSTRPKN